MGKSRTFVLLFVAGCQSMYGDKAQRLRTPEPIRPPSTLPQDPVVTIYQEKCDFFTVKVPKVKRETAQAEAHVRDADEKVAGYDKATDGLRQGFKRTVVGSVGPVCTQVLRQFGIEPDIEPVHPKMGSLIAEIAARAREVLAKKSE